MTDKKTDITEVFICSVHSVNIHLLRLVKQAQVYMFSDSYVFHSRFITKENHSD